MNTSSSNTKFAASLLFCLATVIMSGNFIFRRLLTTTTSPNTNVRLLLTNVNNVESAEKIAFGLVEKRLASCINILPGITSIYRWKGKVEKETEVTLMIKTTKDNYKDVENYLIGEKNHPYEVPELIEIKIDRGFEKYLQWVQDEVE